MATNEWVVTVHIVYRTTYKVVADTAEDAARHAEAKASEDAPGVLAHYDTVCELPVFHAVEAVNSRRGTSEGCGCEST